MAENKKNTATAVDKVEDKAPVKSDLITDQGRTVIEDVVVTKIAGIATREVTGVHDLGGGAARFVGAMRERIPGGSVNVQQGISVEVGEYEAAVDVAVVAEYGVAIHELAEAIRRNIIQSVERMTGLSVTEVNVTVHDVHLEGDDNEDEDDEAEAPAPRVQ
ncbi:Asp23/Gls24 family envelope stress response protein [Corynebacterium sp. 335C]